MNYIKRSSKLYFIGKKTFTSKFNNENNINSIHHINFYVRNALRLATHFISKLGFSPYAIGVIIL